MMKKGISPTEVGNALGEEWRGLTAAKKRPYQRQGGRSCWLSRRCIPCACCMTLCHSYWRNPEYYSGPTMPMRTHLRIADSRYEFAEEPLAWVDDAMKLYRCHGWSTSRGRSLRPTRPVGRGC